MTEARHEVPPSGARHHLTSVTAVVVTRGLTEYLPETVAALAAQSRAPQRVLVADVGHPNHHGHHHAADADRERSRSEIAALLAEHWSAGPPDPESATVVPAPEARTFGHAVRTALAADDPSHGADLADEERWLWLLHDDSAPEPTALAELLAAVEVAPSVAIAGCKQRTWSRPERVLEVGLTTSRFGRRMTGVDEPELDQGQHDGRDDVLAVGTAGALVRRDVWDDLGGPDPALGPYGDGLDLSRRARLAGHRVVVVPRAVVRHAQASLARPVGGAVLNRPGWDARRSTQARREAYLHSQLVGVPVGLVPVVAVLAVASGLVRALGRFVTKEPHLVLAELLAPWAVLARPGRVVRARRRASATRRLGRRSLRPLQVTWRDVASQARDRRLAAAERRRSRQAPSELELRELAALRTRRRVALGAVGLTLVVLTLVVLGPIVTRVAGGARLTGGSLPFGDADLGGLWAAATSAWVAGGFGAPGPVDPLLVALLPVTAVVGTVGRAAALVLLGALVLAGLGAWFAAGAATRSVAVRAWAALVWVGAPALLIGLGQGRLGGVLAHVALPWVVLGVARAIGVARTDAVESGLVGARRGAGLRSRGPVEVDGDAAEQPEVVAEPVAGPVAEPVAETGTQPSTGAAPTVPDRAGPARGTAEPSLGAAAGAGLAFVVATAGAPVLLPVGLLALAVVALVGPRGRRLAWVALPAVAVQAPMIAEAVSTWTVGGWRLLLADPGLPVAGSGAPAWQQLLGWPVDVAEVAAPVTLQAPYDVVVPLVATGTVLLVAVLALALAGRAGVAVRTGWVLVACGLGAAVVAARVQVGVAQTADGAVLTTAWSGGGLSLALAGLLLAATVGAAGARSTMARHAFGWRQVGAGVLTVLAVAGPALVLGGWSWQVRQDAGALALETTERPQVPAAGRQLQQTPDAARVLALDAGGGDEVRATLLRHDGVQLTEVSRSTTSRPVGGGWASADVRDLDDADAQLAEVAAQMAGGSTDDVARGLARLGIGAVLVPPASTDAAADDAAEAARMVLIGRIDSTPGLERVTETESGVVWRVADVSIGTTAAWARLVDAAGGVGGTVLEAVPSRDGRIDTDLPAADRDRLLVLAERSDPGWRASLDGTPLRSVGTNWRQAFEVGPEGGRLVVDHAPTARTPWLVVQGAVLLVTVLLALPTRRRRGVSR